MAVKYFVKRTSLSLKAEVRGFMPKKVNSVHFVSKGFSAMKSKLRFVVAPREESTHAVLRSHIVM